MNQGPSISIRPDLNQDRQDGQDGQEEQDKTLVVAGVAGLALRVGPRRVVFRIFHAFLAFSRFRPFSLVFKSFVICFCLTLRLVGFNVIGVFKFPASV